MDMITPNQVDEQRLQDLAGKAASDAASGLAVLLAYMGDQTGIYRAMRDLGRARALFAQALETPGGLKIQTIHAFCERLLQRFPVEAGVVPGFTVMDEIEARDILSEVRRSVLAEARRLQGPAAAALAKVVEQLIRAVEAAAVAGFGVADAVLTKAS